MFINKIDNTNFQAIYKVKNLAGFANEIENRVIPTYESVSNQAAVKIVGDNPYKKHIFRVLDKLAKKNNSSRDWAERNAKNHGIDTSIINEDTVYVFTGNDEVIKLGKYMAGRNSRLKPTFIDKIREFFSIPKKNDVEFPEDLPSDLYSLYLSVNIDKNETQAFSEYLEAKKVIDANSPQDLLFKMLHER